MSNMVGKTLEASIFRGLRQVSHLTPLKQPISRISNEQYANSIMKMLNPSLPMSVETTAMPRLAILIVVAALSRFGTNHASHEGSH